MSGAAYVFDTPGAWTDLGGGTSGTAGTPRLVAGGTLFAEASTMFALEDSPRDAPFIVWVSLTPVPFPALGGTVHAYPFVHQVLLWTDATGSFGAALAWPTLVPSGTEVWFQCLVQDAAVPAGLSLEWASSNLPLSRTFAAAPGASTIMLGASLLDSAGHHGRSSPQPSARHSRENALPRRLADS
jgi:hypothetical protein